jgi:sugar O-acyltransferase (sialic acid O-acetyltransferase NeuD family)
MKLKELILVGAGGHARACIDVIEQTDNYQIAGLVGLKEEVGTLIDDYAVLAVDSDLSKLATKFAFALITVGQIDSPTIRIHLYQEAKRQGFSMATVISPRAYVSRSAIVEEGSIVMHGAVINAGARIGRNCIINSGALIEHDSIISDHCHISTGALVNGKVSIGEGVFVGSGAVIREGIDIGAYSVVGMGQTVRHDLASKSRLAGDSRP